MRWFRRVTLPLLCHGRTQQAAVAFAKKMPAFSTSMLSPAPQRARTPACAPLPQRPPRTPMAMSKTPVLPPIVARRRPDPWGGSSVKPMHSEWIRNADPSRMPLRRPPGAGAHASGQSLKKLAEANGYERAVRGLKNALPDDLRRNLNFESSQELLNISHLRAEIKHHFKEHECTSPWRHAAFARKSVFEDKYINDWRPANERKRSPTASAQKEAVASHMRHARKTGPLWSTPPPGMRIAIKRVVSDDAVSVC